MCSIHFDTHSIRNLGFGGGSAVYMYNCTRALDTEPISVIFVSYMYRICIVYVSYMYRICIVYVSYMYRRKCIVFCIVVCIVQCLTSIVERIQASSVSKAVLCNIKRSAQQRPRTAAPPQLSVTTHRTWHMDPVWCASGLQSRCRSVRKLAKTRRLLLRLSHAYSSRACARLCHRLARSLLALVCFLCGSTHVRVSSWLRS